DSSSSSSSSNKPLLLRLAVKSGGCSGLSYALEKIEQSDLRAEDHVESFDFGVSFAIDPISFFYVFGTELVYSRDLMGGGFK
ncbi:HesB-like domain containing protein, putative, partial [Eimeria tenella]